MDHFDRLVGRARGEVPLASPSVPSLFEPTSDTGAWIEEEAVETESDRSTSARDATRERSPTTSPGVPERSAADSLVGPRESEEVSGDEPVQPAPRAAAIEPSPRPGAAVPSRAPAASRPQITATPTRVSRLVAAPRAAPSIEAPQPRLLGGADARAVASPAASPHASHRLGSPEAPLFQDVESSSLRPADQRSLSQAASGARAPSSPSATPAGGPVASLRSEVEAIEESTEPRRSRSARSVALSRDLRARARAGDTLADGSSAGETIVHVTIGRVDVHATPQPAGEPQRAKRDPARGVLTLAEITKRRAGSP
jgi:hypothetical protein